MEHTEHVLIVDPDAEFVERFGLDVAETGYFITPGRRQQLDRVINGRAVAARHGTVGAAARDAGGRVAAATSTGGMTGQADGRVGDSPIVGAGVYARDNVVAISCTGDGEAFIRGVVAWRLRGTHGLLVSLTTRPAAIVRWMGRQQSRPLVGSPAARSASDLETPGRALTMSASSRIL